MTLRSLYLWLWLCISVSLSFSSQAVDCSTDTTGLCTPTIEEIERAKTLIDKYQSQDAAFVEIDGILLEKPVVDRLYRTLAIADRIKS